ncbi:MAG: hypothetical protein GY798_18765 [Hyphomicrobiales bacterium]|nr:hypothetical protein [Hyphomicrobiales bacterium]
MAVCFSRPDGLGARLIGLVGAMRVARRLNTEFLFHWSLMPAQHVREPVTVDEIFSPDFVTRHHREAFAGERERMQRRLRSRARPIDEVEAAEAEDHLYYHRPDIARFADETAADAERQARDIFGTLPFHPDIRATMDAARRSFDRALAGQKSLGIHVRLGDVAGPLRRIHWFGSKYLPADYYHRAIDSLGEQVDRIVLFSNDRNVREVLGVASAKISVSSQIFDGSDGNDAQAAMADMVMLGHCDEIFAPPDSMFSRAAGIFHGTPMRSFESIFTRDELFDEWMAWRDEHAALLADHARIVATRELLAVGEAERALENLGLVIVGIGDDWIHETTLQSLYPRCLWAAGRKEEAIVAAERVMPLGIENVPAVYRQFARWMKDRDPERSRAITEALDRLR